MRSSKIDIVELVKRLRARGVSDAIIIQKLCPDKLHIDEVIAELMDVDIDVSYTKSVAHVIVRHFDYNDPVYYRFEFLTKPS